MASGRSVAVVGGGWAGLAAAIEATRRGAHVTLLEMAPQLGGRARAVEADGLMLDNGQHICIGAYAETLRLLADVGVPESAAFLRMPLCLVDSEGRGLRLSGGPPFLAFMRSVAAHPGWPWSVKLALMGTAGVWMMRRFRCDPGLTVAELTRSLPADVREEMIDPLCVAALNTPPSEASGEVFLRVLGDALFAGAGSADLLFPRVGLSELLPGPAERWLAGRGAEIHLRHRVEALEAEGTGWRVDGQRFEAVVLAASPVESARLVVNLNSDWATAATALRYEPIVTVYLRSDGARLPEPMLALRSAADGPAQFVFDRGQLGGPSGLLAFVISGAQPWVDAGSEKTLAATHRQAHAALHKLLPRPLETICSIAERRATIRCTPGLLRPPMQIGRNFLAAGDHVEGPYPSTLEGAVRSGRAAACALHM